MISRYFAALMSLTLLLFAAARAAEAQDSAAEKKDDGKLRIIAFGRIRTIAN